MNEEMAYPAHPRGGGNDHGRWELIRDVIVFQGKLFVDGLRDLVMAPVSIGLAVLDLLGVASSSGGLFYRFLGWGRLTEKWIGLFNAAQGPDALSEGDRGGVDSLVEQIERVVRRDHARGGITASTKRAVDRALNGLQDRREP